VEIGNKKMKNIIMAAALSACIATSALAETFTFVVPQKPGSGTMYGQKLY